MNPARLFAALAVCLVCVAAAGDEPAVFEPLKGNDLSAWREPTGEWAIVGDVSMSSQNPRQLQWQAGTGTLVNGPHGKTPNLLTRREFGDVQAHIEFMIPKRSNSGVFFMGRYELQIYDSFGVKKDKYPGIECGGIYPRWIDDHGVNGHSPLVNASLPPGQWQTFDVTFRAPRFDKDGKKTANGVFVKVVHNGQVVQENVEVTGPTRSATFDDERPTGPIMLQGDHGPVAFRNIRIRPLAGADATTAPSAVK